MDSRERFREVMRYGVPDRVPLFEEGIRTEVVQAWRMQGMPPDVELSDLFTFDRHESIEPELGPLPRPAAWPSSISELSSFRSLLNLEDPARLSGDWSDRARRSSSSGSTLMLSACDGLFLSLGVDGWHSFSEVARRLACEPQVVLAIMRIQGEFAALMAERILREAAIDAAVFSEPLCGNHGPLISPRMYEEFALKSYEPILQVLRRNRIGTIIFMTWGNARLLLPAIVRYGFNCLWAYEANAPAMDYRGIRREFGRNLRLIGGIDLDKIREGEEASRREILDKVPPLLADGGYIPLADGRVREDVPYRNYVRYRRLLEEVARPSS